MIIGLVTGNADYPADEQCRLISITAADLLTRPAAVVGPVAIATPLLSHYTDNLRQTLTSVTVKPSADTVTDFYCSRRIYEIGRTNLDSRSTGHKELYSVLSSHDTAKAYHGNIHGMGHIVDHRSIRMPIRVLMSDTASAPSASQALAMELTSVTLGESFTIIVLW